MESGEKGEGLGGEGKAWRGEDGGGGMEWGGWRGRDGGGRHWCGVKEGGEQG